MSMPDYIPELPLYIPELPIEGDFCKHQITSNNKHCTVGWMIDFGIPVTPSVQRAWHLAADDAGIPRETRGLVRRQDQESVTQQQLAAAFRGMLERLGYEIIE